MRCCAYFTLQDPVVYKNAIQKVLQLLGDKVLVTFLTLL